MMAFFCTYCFAFSVLVANAGFSSPNPICKNETTPNSLEKETGAEKALQYLLKMQSADGAWRSKTYGTMSQGAAITSLVLYSISHLPKKQIANARPSIDRAVSFLKKGLARNNCVCNPDGSLDYPVYSSALLLTVHKRIGIGLTKTEEQNLVEYLLACQCDKKRGFERDNPNYGGWDILGPGATAGKTAGANVSVTFYVLEALKVSQNPQARPAIDNAKSWCQQIVAQTAKGGFYFTTQQNSTLNKAGTGSQLIPRSYGSATCDGLGIMLLTGFGLDSAEVSTTIGWIKSHPNYSSVPGFKSEDESGWDQGLKFYYLAALARCLRQMPGDHAVARNSIRRTLEKLQKSDGSFANSSMMMREDDPLIATAFALQALSQLD